ncbi:hemicentin-1-like [Mytilus trossulus]|uniref:hemicentin-1-like n=1 Tax=Mytilus trossulus TaxID=6551 RepID=UPI003006D70C
MILLLFLTIGILHTVKGTEPAVEISYEEVTPPYMATLYSIRCSVTHMPVNSNLWLSMISSAGGYVENFTGESNRRFWFTVRNDSDSSVTVVFDHFIPQYEGQYTCVVREKTDDNPLEWSSKSVYLKYTTMPEIQDLIYDHAYIFNYDHRRLFLNDGSALQLQCAASGVPEPKVEWKKKGNDNYVIEGPLLDVPSVTKADSGFYFCEADNGIGDPVRSTELEVKVLDFFPPKMRYTSEPVITITEDLNRYWRMAMGTKMEVLVNGLPPPTVTWWKETEIGRERIMRESTSTHRFSIYEGFVIYPETETDHELFIDAPTQFQLGTYVAKAENSLGVTELNFTINAMPEIQDLIYDHAYTFNYDHRRLFLNDGSALQLQCAASGVPEPKVEWKKKGNDNYVIEGPLLDVPSVTKADSGFYFCEADNGIGDPVRSTELEVKVLDFFPPKMRYTSEPVITITEDLNRYWRMAMGTKMEVLVNGLPPPTVTWWKETEIGRERIMGESTSTHRFSIYEGFVIYPETETDHKLFIDAPTQFQLGTYVAKAENSLGVTELNFTINAAETTYTIQR